MMIENGRCPELDDALNSIPGIRTIESGCSYMKAVGNTKGKSVNTWIYIRENKVLYPLARCLDDRYDGLPWKLVVDTTDIPENPVCYHLQSVNVDKKALEDSRILAKYLNDYMNDKSLLKHFGLDTIYEEQNILDIKDYRSKNIDKVLDE
jgi:hypothetical protein